PPRSPIECWAAMRKKFGELRDTLETMRLETFEQARDRTSPEWYDDEIGLRVRAWLLIPYNPAVNWERVEDALRYARSLIPALERLFEEQRATMEFASTWGQFCFASGQIELLAVSNPGDSEVRRKERLKGAKSTRFQQRWV